MPKTALPIHPTAVVVYVTRHTDHGDEFLMLQRAEGDSFAGVWAGVAGGIEPGEKAWEAALRELKEEAGLEAMELYSADDIEFFYEWTRDRIYMFPIFMAVVSPDAKVVISEEHQDFEWLPVEKACDRMSFEQQKASLQRMHRVLIQKKPSDWLKIEIPRSAVV